jgi:Gpi18-like mannosyltransferase
MKPVITFFAAVLLLNAASAQTVVFSEMESWKTNSVGFPPTTLDATSGWRCPDSLAFAYSILGFYFGKSGRRIDECRY